MEKRPDNELEHHRKHHRGHDDFFGLDVEKTSPKAQVTASLAVLVPVAVAGVLVLALIPWLWWLIFVFGWTIFPALGLLVRGVAGLSEGGTELLVGNSKERELLGALKEHGELTPARAAMETSLSVAEADRMLKELTEGGHLEVRVEGSSTPSGSLRGARESSRGGIKVLMYGVVRGIIFGSRSGRRAGV